MQNILCDKCPKPCNKEMKGHDQAKYTYFYLLHKYFDPISRERIFYFGSLHRLFANIKFMSLSFSIGAFLVLHVDVMILVISLFGYTWLTISLGETVLNIISAFILGCGLLILWWRFPLGKGDRLIDCYKYQKRYLDLEIEKIRKILCKDETTE